MNMVSQEKMIIRFNISTAMHDTAMRGHCMKSVQIRSFLWSVFSPNARKYGPEKTPYLDNFHTVGT